MYVSSECEEKKVKKTPSLASRLATDSVNSFGTGGPGILVIVPGKK